MITHTNEEHNYIVKNLRYSTKLATGNLITSWTLGNRLIYLRRSRSDRVARLRFFSLENMKIRNSVTQGRRDGEKSVLMFLHLLPSLPLRTIHHDFLPIFLELFLEIDPVGIFGYIQSKLLECVLPRERRTSFAQCESSCQLPCRLRISVKVNHGCLCLW